ncbi:MAG: ATP-binding cassette domain-containing protein [Spartobacteria bacterium]|nr:ATP-binding cassette domain-containing protein [Spartobacteria bacterium]
MIHVEHLTKRFSRNVAVDDVSFQVTRGEIVGFLGPNGAGKTTTMRILSGYMPATGGVVEIGGRNVFDESLEVRKRIGYMPENVPLYPELRVNEYLRYRARLKGVPRRQCRKRVDLAREQCGLKDEGRRIIGQLSKGYRQRVGLADALVHDPELLILDEPTIGLDPEQIRQVRELIRTLAEQHTIILSTHILPEVEMTCQRVLIINKGRIIASDSPANLSDLMRGGTRVVIEVHAPHEEVFEQLHTLPHVQRVTYVLQDVWNRYDIECGKDIDLRQNVFELVVRRGWKLRELKMEKSSLEEVFVTLIRDRDRQTARETRSAAGVGR